MIMISEHSDQLERSPCGSQASPATIDTRALVQPMAAHPYGAFSSMLPWIAKLLHEPARARAPENRTSFGLSETTQNETLSGKDREQNFKKLQENVTW